MVSISFSVYAIQEKILRKFCVYDSLETQILRVDKTQPQSQIVNIFIHL